MMRLPTVLLMQVCMQVSLLPALAAAFVPAVPFLTTSRPDTCNRDAQFNASRRPAITRIKTVSAIQQISEETFPLATELFPNAMVYQDVGEFMIETLVNTVGYDIEKTLCATSMCHEERNQPFETTLAQTFDHNYNFNYLYYSGKLPSSSKQATTSGGGGGLAGCPFGGVPSFRKMKLHVPDGGDCILVYGPHMGLSLSGQVGTITDGDATDDSALCCQSAILASNYVGGVYRGETEPTSLPMNPIDAGQYFVGNMLLPHAERLELAGPNRMVELPYALFEAQTEMLQRIIREGCGPADDDDDGEGYFPGRLTVLGGIQINTPPGKHNYFVPLTFDLYNAQGNIEANLFDTQQ